LGYFYTFNVKIDGKWQGETEGINAKAVGVNGKRGAIIDMTNTDPIGWEVDERPNIILGNTVIYEMHHRDFSISKSSGITNKGKYLALTEHGTTNPEGASTGIDHLIDLGVTHVHILPSYDFGSVDETTLQKNQYNWGYDPVNYNVPEGSYSTDPYDPEIRIREFKNMVMNLHKSGIRLVLDVVYNHTFDIQNSPFNLTAPGYFYRERKDSSYANGSGCGNETASERAMMRKYMIESVKYWATEYHVDGFRFDLMGIHDLQTMRDIRAALDEIDPSIIIYGEGWAAEAPQLPADTLAMKANVSKMAGISVFSDELRDGLRGPFNDDHKGGFPTNVPGQVESIKFGIVGGIPYPNIDYKLVNYTDTAWASEPTQMISYVSCHDDMCLVDRLKTTNPNISEEELIRLDKLAQTVVFTSQGIPFMLAGEEMLRNKKGVHNSYNSPDSINQIDWNNKTKYQDVYEYYKNLITLRKMHSAFHIGSAELIRQYLHFLPVGDLENVIAYRIDAASVGDVSQEITVIFNSSTKPIKFILAADSKYTIVCENGKIDPIGLRVMKGSEAIVAAQSAWIAIR
ncbi:MAG: type I pullulanase, partial [Bacteroidaceae bacterium]